MHVFNEQTDRFQKQTVCMHSELHGKKSNPVADNQVPVINYQL